MVRKGFGWCLILMLVMGLVFAFAGVAAAQAKNAKGWYVFDDYKVCPVDKYFKWDKAKKRWVDSGYASYMTQSMAQRAVMEKAAADRYAKQRFWRKVALYFPVTTAPAYVFECSQAKAVGFVAARNWALANGKDAPWGCEAYSELLGGVFGVANIPEGPAFTLINGAFCGFNGQLDPLTGMGIDRGLLVNLGVIAAKGTIFGLTATPGYHGFFRVADIYFHNALAWSGMTTIPANMLANAGYGFMGKSVPYKALFEYQTTDKPLSAVNADWSKQYKANSKFSQIVF